MKKLLLSAFLASAAFTTPACAETFPAPVVCVVSQATLDQSSALKSIVSQLEKKRAEVQKELAADEKRLKEEDARLSEQHKTLSEKEFATKRQDFERRVHEVQAKLEVRRVQMEMAFEDAKKKVYEAFLNVANDVKKDVGANMILYKETIVTADPNFDVSAKVLEKLDKALPTVSVTFKSESDIKKLMQQRGPQG